MNTSTHPIAALATPPGRGALAVIRLSGDGVHEIFADIITEKEKFALENPRKIDIYTIVDDVDVSRETLKPFYEDGGYPRNAPPKTDYPKTHTLKPLRGQKSPSGDFSTLTSTSVSNQSSDIVDDNNVSRETIPVTDEVTAIKYAAPKSFTGEDMVEIFCHGGAVIPQKILDRLYRAGARAAGRGEFTRRAWENGKMDLLKAESIAGLIDCQTEKHLKSAQLAYSGKQLKSLEILKTRIVNILSDVESRIEFAEEDDIAHSEQGLLSANKRELALIIDELEEDLRRSERVKTLDDGVIIALAGPPNAGKSSLFNEILGYDRSIVHDRPGTTRDAVSEKILFDGVTVKLFDCAGIRDTDDTVEQRGIERTLFAVKDAHVVIWVTSAEEPFDVGECEEILENRDKVLVVINKIDKIEVDVSVEKSPNGDFCPRNGFSMRDLGLSVLGGALRGYPPSSKDFKDFNVSRETLSSKKIFCNDNTIPHITVSLTQKINTDDLFYRMKSTIRTVTDPISAPEIVLNARHRGIIVEIVDELRDCLAYFDREEIAAQYLKKALELTAEFLGHVAGDEVLDEIFGKFCIGK